ncbi:Terpene synthase 10 [Platanthera zijinensis]|uniref:Terpene synthase 10 n=1 Tax=Platanthera zijinensis TaxID=2320716 RepID=A0AAP0B0L0_9ASPA
MKNPSTDGGRQPPPPSRRTANYPPSIWDDGFIQSLPDGSLDKTQLDLWEKLKEDMRHLIHDDKQKDSVELLELVDNMRRLGVSYHYESEIKNLLRSISSSLLVSLENKKNMHASALLFRLLREYGFQVQKCADILLNSIKNESWILDTGINAATTVKGMLSLYEASYIAFESEHELNEAREITTKCLSNYLKEPLLINQHLFEQIDHALDLPLHWSMPRVYTRWYIDAYGRQENMNPKLLQFSNLDFNMLQCLYKKELKELSRWWRNLGLVGDEFSFARDRLVEIYFWSVGCTFEPQFWRCRKEITKLGCLLTTIDDIYDVYGSLEELEVFTNDVHEWKISAILPNFMKKTLTALFNTLNDIAHIVLVEKDIDILPHLRRVWEYQCKSYLLEAKWYYTGYTPTLNEYLENAWLSATCPLLTNSAYFLSEELTKEALDSLEFYPDVVRYSSIVARLYDDLGTSTDEVERGDVPKSIQCHMKEANVTEKVARDHIRYLIARYWKTLNAEYIANPNLAESFNRYLLNFPRMAQCIYQYGDGHGKGDLETRNRIISLFIKPVI